MTATSTEAFLLILGLVKCKNIFHDYHILYIVFGKILTICNHANLILLL